MESSLAANRDILTDILIRTDYDGIKSFAETNKAAYITTSKPYFWKIKAEYDLSTYNERDKYIIDEIDNGHIEILQAIVKYDMLANENEKFYDNVIYYLIEQQLFTSEYLPFLKYLIKNAPLNIFLDWIHYLIKTARLELLDVVLSTRKIKDLDIYEQVISALKFDNDAYLYGDDISELVTILDKHTDLSDMTLVKLSINNELTQLLTVLVDIVEIDDADILDAAEDLIYNY